MSHKFIRNYITKSELAVARLLYFPSKEIAKRLFISTTTIKSHISAMYYLTGTHRRHELIIKLLKEGILELEDIEYDK